VSFGSLGIKDVEVAAWIVNHRAGSTRAASRTITSRNNLRVMI